MPSGCPQIYDVYQFITMFPISVPFKMASHPPRHPQGLQIHGFHAELRHADSAGVEFRVVEARMPGVQTTGMARDQR